MFTLPTQIVYKMVYIKFSDLSQEKQTELLDMAKDDIIYAIVEKQLKEEAKGMGIDYEVYLTQKAESHLYSYDYTFNI